ncbi:hypothetical protein SSX86_022276 [Deinandra increscens subsp. villosa]|uniref:Membrane protein of ER body-like protein n=1 Tax=Deinandra increscens subsp. villosa TaxID=3103831 RepID=A0AAP0CK24_9ASTR
MEVALDHHTRNSDDEISFGSAEDTDVEDGLKTRKSRRRYSGITVPLLSKPGDGDGDGESSENAAYLDKNGGAIEDLNIKKTLNSAQYDVNGNGVTETAINGGGEVMEAKSDQIKEEIVEEEVVELEFENAIPKLGTHTMHCPNCDHQITRVVLRRKIVKRRPQVTEESRDPVDLLGCFSCFSLFTSTGNGGFNPFSIFGNKPTSSAVLREDGNDVVSEDGNCFSIFRVFRKDSKQPKPGNIYQDSEQPKQENIDQDFKKPQPGNVDQESERPKPGEVDQPSPLLNKLPVQQGVTYLPNVVGREPSRLQNQPPADGVPSHYDQKLPQTNDQSSIDILPDTTPEIQDPSPGISERQDSKSFEILKSIVYGGLMEVIASLSIVASAAAGGATTLNIIALALANLTGGIFVIGHNLWDLKDDCYKFSTQQTNNQEQQQPRTKYKELLGSVEHFPLHAFFALLSFLVFGTIPPLAYGYAFHRTNNTDLTMVIVAAASFICVGLLAIFKAYIDRCTGFSGYVKTVTYYLTTAVTVSGVSYAAGNLVKMLIEDLGLFDTIEVMSTNPSLAYY